MVFADPFETLFNFQQTLDALRASSWLESTPSGGGPYPPLNVFRKDDDFVIITEIPGVQASDIDIKVRATRSESPALRPSITLTKRACIVASGWLAALIALLPFR
jgi:hypothetical protein